MCSAPECNGTCSLPCEGRKATALVWGKPGELPAEPAKNILGLGMCRKKGTGRNVAEETASRMLDNMDLVPGGGSGGRGVSALRLDSERLD
mmetsp:Transcript_28461/g.83192  ORF Transcript_28461/g.83192 Transcript_28461/m.83192 type:complete len:91 (-) Transcript_28461:333-605(-)